MPIPSVTKDDIFLAILAMDTYHRGVNAGIQVAGLGIGGDGVGTQIGTATIVQNSQDGYPQGETPEDNVGFYAIRYNWDVAGDGQNIKTVYAYRGTDRGFADITADGDIRNGYVLAAGLPNATQALAAAEFFSEVPAEEEAPKG